MLKMRSGSSRRAKPLLKAWLASVVTVLIALSGCRRRPTSVDDEPEPGPTAADSARENPASSAGAANLVPMTDLESSEWLKFNQPWKGDLSQTRERPFIRALVVYNRTVYLLDAATQRGHAYDSLLEIEKGVGSRSGRGLLAPKILI